jgi:hypothetical protein
MDYSFVKRRFFSPFYFCFLFNIAKEVPRRRASTGVSSADPPEEMPARKKTKGEPNGQGKGGGASGSRPPAKPSPKRTKPGWFMARRLETQQLFPTSYGIQFLLFVLPAGLFCLVFSLMCINIG